MPDDMKVAPGVRIPAAALEMRAVRASGPGGQNVNKVASRVELLVEMSLIEGLDEKAAARLRALAARRMDADGRLRVTSQESRDRHRNLETAREKVRLLVAKSLAAPKARRATRPSAARKEERLRAKHRDAEVKRARRTRGEED